MKNGRSYLSVLRGAVLRLRNSSEQEHAERKLLRLNEELSDKVAALTAANQAAIAANRAKDRFLANLSHELRTPLAPVMALLTSWASDITFPAELIADVRLLKRNVELQTRLIDDLLDMTRIVSGKVSLECKTTDLHELLAAVAAICDSELKAKQIALLMRLESPRYHSHVDAARIQQVFWNILKNAVKFTPTGGSIEIATQTTLDGSIRITIRDSGIGMTSEVLGRIFRPFEQGSSETVRRFGGLGLGMAISKSLIESQGGTLTAASEGLGQGSTFTVCIAPVRTPVPARSPAPARTPGNSANSQRSPPRNILIVDDHADTANSMARLLKGIGYRVTVAYSVAGAATALNGGGVDLLLCDLRLPDGSGIDVVRQLRERHHQRIPAIAMTGFTLDSDIARCRDAGFSGHVSKPVNFNELEIILANLAVAN